MQDFNIRTTLPLPFTSEQILGAYVVMSFFSLFPFLVADLALVNSKKDPCLYYGYLSGFQLTDFTLGQWIRADGIIKLAALVFIVFMYVVSLQLRCKSTILAVVGNFIRIFYVFIFGWNVACCSIFWSTPYDEDLPLYLICGRPYQGYISTQLLAYFVIIPINIGVASLRSNFIEQQRDQQQKPLKNWIVCKPIQNK